ncbi:MAG: sun protein [Firmicutes bacterium]|nr:sun protein [Bacillota bacterium]
MNAREIALKIINDVNVNEAYANISLARELDKHILSDQDRRFVTELVYGTIKTGKTLDWIISRYVNRPLSKIAPIILDILRMGVYQIFFMSKVPNSAACNQSVEISKKYGHIGTVKFINGVLRNVVRMPEKAKYPTMEEDRVKHLALEYYHPEWLIERWINRLGFEETRELCVFNNIAPPLSIRTNTLKNTRSELADILKKEEVEFKNSIFTPEGIICTIHPAISNLKSLQNGLFQIQDESSMLVAHVVDPQPGEFIIDTCSAPGGKTTHLAALMKNDGKILATDIYDHKLLKINENAKRLGINIIETKLIDATQIGELYKGKADRVLVDAPCSGLGVLRRKPDSRWRKSETLLYELPILQNAILTSAAAAVKLGGTLVYSTCTTEVEENQNIINHFLSSRTDFELEKASDFLPTEHLSSDMIQLWPHIDGVDGFFIARMKRIK